MCSFTSLKATSYWPPQTKLSSPVSCPHNENMPTFLRLQEQCWHNGSTFCHWQSIIFETSQQVDDLLVFNYICLSLNSRAEYVQLPQTHSMLRNFCRLVFNWFRMIHTCVCFNIQFCSVDGVGILCSFCIHQQYIG